MRIGVYPGSFDPPTLGHLNIIERASTLFDKVIVATMVNGSKKSAFTMEEKADFLRRMTQHLPNVEIDTFGGLLADYVAEKGACAIVKGLRAVSDFEYEFQMALANKKLNEGAETVFLMTDQNYLYLSSTIVRDIARHGGDISGFVSEEIREDIVKKLYQKNNL
ncbi:MAG: pantetheine-phosphate adenylyltransferase [Butyricicoccus sp.]|jgi:pantetheine-phosphate adenylyltransferase|nr:pantetheine-phosphate adenylyltransferase [Clostridiales bacterium]